MAIDISKPFNDLPLLPPNSQIENDVKILKKLVIASRCNPQIQNTVFSA